MDLTQTQNPTNDVSYDDITAELMAGRTNEPPANPTNEPPVAPPAPAAPPANQPPANTPPADPAAPPVVPANEPPADPNAAPEKDWYEEEPTNEPAVDPNAPQNQAPQVDPLYAKYADVLADPEIQLILDLKKSGKSIHEIQKEIAIVDFDAMTPAEVVAHDMKMNGATQDEINAHLSEFDAKQTWEKNKEAASLKAYYKSQQDQKFQNIRAGAQKMTAEQQAAEQQKIKKIEQELTNYASSLIGQKKYGLQLTEADVAKSINRFFNGYPEHYNPDGTPNVQKIIDAGFIYDNINRIAKALEQKFLTNGARQVAETVNNASKQIPGSTTHVNSQGTIEDAVGGINPYLDK